MVVDLVERKAKLIQELQQISPGWAEKIESCRFNKRDRTRLGQWGRCVVGEAHGLDLKRRWVDDDEYECQYCSAYASTLGIHDFGEDGLIDKLWLTKLACFIRHWKKKHE